MTYPSMSYCIEKGIVQHFMNQHFEEKLCLTILCPEMLFLSLFLCSIIFFTAKRNVGEWVKKGVVQEHFGYLWNSKRFVSKSNRKWGRQGNEPHLQGLAGLNCTCTAHLHWSSLCIFWIIHFFFRSVGYLKAIL